MKLHLLFVACMTLFILSCGENNSGDKKDDKRTATLMVSNGNHSGQCQSVGLAILNYKGRYYQIDQSNQNLMNTVQMLYQQSMYGGGSGGYPTSGYNGGYPTSGYNGGYPTTGYNGGYPTSGYNGGGYNNNYSNYNIISQDECTVHYRMEFEGRTSNVNNGYGGYGGMETMSITSYRIR